MISADMLAGALNDDIGSQEYVDTICGLHNLDSPDPGSQKAEEMDVKEGEEQSQIPFHWRIEHNGPSDMTDGTTPKSNHPEGEETYVERLEAEVSRLDHEVTRLEVQSNLLKIRNADISERLQRMGGVVQALSQANTKAQGQLRSLQTPKPVPHKKAKRMVTAASQTEENIMEDLQGYQQLCEIVGYVFTDIGRAHTPHDVAEALHPLLEKLCGKNSDSSIMSISNFPKGEACKVLRVQDDEIEYTFVSNFGSSSLDDILDWPVPGSERAIAGACEDKDGSSSDR
ncbi:hypothetical protein FB446DRAFT_709478 [Lentinula raphanica]|nr:hypothetical protein FB446DRAFT_709478 [Lentinula raphanica]